MKCQFTISTEAQDWLRDWSYCGARKVGVKGWLTRKQRAYENPNKDSKVSVSASLSGNGTCCVPGRTCSLKKETGLQSGDAGHRSWGYNVGRETD